MRWDYCFHSDQECGADGLRCCSNIEANCAAAAGADWRVAVNNGGGHNDRLSTLWPEVISRVGVLGPFSGRQLRGGRFPVGAGLQERRAVGRSALRPASRRWWAKGQSH